MLLVFFFLFFSSFFFLIFNSYSWHSILTVASFPVIKVSELYLGSRLDRFVCISSSTRDDLVLQFRQGAHRTLEVFQSDFYFDLIRNTQKRMIVIKKKKERKRRNPYIFFKRGTSEPSDHP